MLKDGVKIPDIYDAGYAIMLYDILSEWQTFRFREEEFRLHNKNVFWTTDRFGIATAKIEDVRRAAVA